MKGKLVPYTVQAVAYDLALLRQEKNRIDEECRTTCLNIGKSVHNTAKPTISQYEYQQLLQKGQSIGLYAFETYTKRTLDIYAATVDHVLRDWNVIDFALWSARPDLTQRESLVAYWCKATEFAYLMESGSVQGQ